MRAVGVALAILTWSVGAAGQAGECKHQLLAGAGVPGTPVYAAPAGEPSLYFHGKLNVNTDGASRSYHPNDPRGKTVALNNVGNAITNIYDAKGKKITCSPRSGACFTRFISTFEAARDAQWNPVGHPRIETDGIIPWQTDPQLGRKAPCLIASGPYKGYFVSQTSKPADATRPTCDQARYIDSLAINAIVLPRKTQWASQGHVAEEFKLVAVRDRATGKIAYAIVGDRGPAGSLGEGSIALAAAMTSTVLSGQETYQQIKALARGTVDYVILNAQDIKVLKPGAVTQAKIDEAGKTAFEAWGGIGRLNACAHEIGGAP